MGVVEGVVGWVEVRLPTPSSLHTYEMDCAGQPLPESLDRSGNLVAGYMLGDAGRENSWRNLDNH